MLITEEEAHAMFMRAVEHAGGVTAYADLLETSAAHISQIKNGSTKISGKVAQDLRLESVKAYRLILPTPSTEQEQYEIKRRKWLAEQVQAGNLPHYDHKGGIRSIGPGKVQD